MCVVVLLRGAWFLHPRLRGPPDAWISRSEHSGTGVRDGKAKKRGGD